MGIRVSRRAAAIRARRSDAVATPAGPAGGRRPRYRRGTVALSVIAVTALLAAGLAIARAGEVSRQAAIALSTEHKSVALDLEEQRSANAARIRELKSVTIDAQGVFDKADPSIVTLFCDLPDGGLEQGTGFAVDVPAPSGYETTLVTAAHVLRNCGEIRVYEAGKSDWVRAHVLDVDSTNDLASFAIKDAVPALVSGGFADESQPVVSIGAPYGYPDSISQGVVSTVYSDLIITDASVNPGNSGGPLLDASGHVLGVARSKLLGGGTLGEFVPMDATCDRLFADCPFA